MKQLKARHSPQGRIDYFAILDTLLDQRAGRENIFMADFERATSRLTMFPEMGLDMSSLGVGLRRILVWDYVVFYRVADTEIVIERIIHGARDIEAALRDY